MDCDNTKGPKAPFFIPKEVHWISARRNKTYAEIRYYSIIMMHIIRRNGS